MNYPLLSQHILEHGLHHLHQLAAKLTAALRKKDFTSERRQSTSKYNIFNIAYLPMLDAQLDYSVQLTYLHPEKTGTMGIQFLS